MTTMKLALWFLFIFIAGCFASTVQITVTDGVVSANCTPTFINQTLSINTIVPSSSNTITVGGINVIASPTPISGIDLNAVTASINVNSGGSLMLNNGSHLVAAAGSSITASSATFSGPVSLNGGFNIGGGSTFDSYSTVTSVGGLNFLPCWNNCASGGPYYRYTKIGKLVMLHLSSFTSTCTPGFGPTQYSLPAALWTPGDTTTEIEVIVAAINPSGTCLADVALSNGILSIYWITGISSTTGTPVFDSPNGVCGLRQTTITYFMS